MVAEAQEIALVGVPTQPPEAEREDIGVRLVVVSNRLPIVLKRSESKWIVEPGGGGLVTAMSPVLKKYGGVWVGWTGTTEKINWEKELDLTSIAAGFNLIPVHLTPAEADNFYLGFSNQIVWPLFHDLQTRCNFQPQFWKYYLQVNQKYAEVIAEHSQESDFVWVHDYHLMMVAQEIRNRGINRTIGFFLHIPFPPLDIFLRLPWRRQVLEALMHHQVLGFQTERDRVNFLSVVEHLLPDCRIKKGKGRTTVQLAPGSFEYFPHNLPDEVEVADFPISIDYEHFVMRSKSREVESRARWLKEQMAGSQIMIGIDRLDYTKGLPEKLEAFRLALKRHPDLRRRLTLVQIVVPSRTDVPEYKNLKAEIEQLVGEINGQYTIAGWVPIHYIFRSLPEDELYAYYRAAQIALVTPLKDGMNLVAKEYCACHLEDDGVLILSEFAGAAYQLGKGALLVNPYDLEGVAEAIYTAFTMPIEEKRRRLNLLKSEIKRHDIFWWVKTYLKAALSEK